MAVIGGFRSDLQITRKTEGNFGKVSAGVLFSKVAYQGKWWYFIFFRTFHTLILPNTIYTILFLEYKKNSLLFEFKQTITYLLLIS